MHISIIIYLSNTQKRNMTTLYFSLLIKHLSEPCKKLLVENLS
jgi:hypothetical protein